MLTFDTSSGSRLMIYSLFWKFVSLKKLIQS